MAVQINFLKYLKIEILCEIFSGYLIIQDISRFDIAICNHANRQIFLATIGSIGCIWCGDKEKRFNRQGINWLSTRNVKIRHLKCDYDVFVGKEKNEIDKTVMRIRSISIHLQWFSINDKYVRL